MPWKRRQPTWPYLAALGGLFLVTLAAPSWWQRRHAHAPTAGARRPVDQGLAAISDPWRMPAPAPQLSEQAPTLPPLANAGARPLFSEATSEPAQIAAPALTEAVVESNDYVVVDEPLVEPVAPATSPSDTASMLSKATPGQTGIRSVLVAPVAAPVAPVRPAISTQTLLRAREVLLELVEQARQYQTPAMAEPRTMPAPEPARVMVDSSSDRLAMVPDLAQPAPTPVDAWALSAVDLRPLGPALPTQPTALLRELAELQTRPAAQPWAARVQKSIEQLTSSEALDATVRSTLLGDLTSLASSGFNEALSVTNPADQSAWIRVSRSLDRRLPVWQLLLDDRAMIELAERQGAAGAEGPLWQSLHQVAALTAGSIEGAGWRSYLRLDDLVGLTSVGGDGYAETRRATARDVLIRMAHPGLTSDQVAFLTQPPLVGLRHDLLPWASGPVSLEALTKLLEHYELTSSQADAETIAELRLRMKWSGDARLEQLADDINRNYRNANFRVAVSNELLNRLIPPQEPVTARVKDEIAGAKVQGRSRTVSEVELRLVPDSTAWHFDLHVDGSVQSRTYTDVGPTRVHNSSRMEYDMTKVIVLDRNGLHITPAEAKVQGRNSLVGIDSALDRVPLVNSVVDGVVRKKHSESQDEAMRYVKAKVRKQAETRMNEEADAKLRAFEDRFATDVWTRLQRFDLSAEPVDMSTTEERAVMRLRMASEQHLGAHTPRPSAPSDSLASFQMHESVFNNAIRSLDLDGKRMTVGELHELLGSKFTARTVEAPADLPQRAIVEFAKRDAVRVACNGDVVELTLNIVEMRKGRDSIRGVGVHAFFRPKIDGLEVKLVRDGTLQFEGAHLRTGPRLVLHSVFGKLLRKDQEIPLLAGPIGADPRLAGLMVTQLVIDDGWVALSVGPAHPERTAWRTRGAATR
jgi:hypothetical protein